jgi:hypothetical protein
LLTVAILFEKVSIHSQLENIYRTTFPSDGDGKLCGTDYPGYKYLYFPDLYDLVAFSNLFSQKECVLVSVLPTVVTD